MDGKGVRLDTYLVTAGFASGREKAKELLAAGYVSVNDKPITKASHRIADGDRVICTAPKQKYVGRGGFKLEEAIAKADLSLTGATAMDVGASTGGFTDCMLQSGAAHVYAVDVGRDQLHPSLREDARVTVLEGTDIRSPMLTETVAHGTVTFCTVDVSFVSLSNVLPFVMPYLSEDATLVCLIKPQFEAGRSAIGKHGVVKDRKAHLRVLTAQMALFTDLGLVPVWLGYSPITGGEGNIEYLAVLRRQGTPCVVDPASVVDTAFTELT